MENWKKVSAKLNERKAREIEKYILKRGMTKNVRGYRKIGCSRFQIN